MKKRILYIPDVQQKEDSPINHLRAAGNYIVRHRPDIVILAGDWWDMPSLNRYGSKHELEGKRIKSDLEAGNKAMKAFMEPLLSLKSKQRRDKKKVYSPRLVFTVGNHDPHVRLPRVYEDYPALEGMFEIPDLAMQYGFEVIPFLEIIEIEGIRFSHYFINPHSAKKSPLGGTIDTMLKNAGFSFVQGHTQGLKMGKHYLADGSCKLGIVAGCLTPDHKVLTSDLRYVPIGELKEGDKLVSFDEHCNTDGKRSRRYKEGTLLRCDRDVREVYEVELESGKKFKVTEDHGWLVWNSGKYRWRMTKDLRRGTRIPKLLDEWEFSDSYEAGWLCGMYDGEGSLYNRPTTGGHIAQLAISQKEGPVLERVKNAINNVLGQETTSNTTHDNVQQIRINGGLTNIAKVLGSLRPQRLLNKFSPSMLGRLNCPRSRDDKVKSITYIGKREIVLTDVDCKTFICEGYPHHNSFYQHNETYMGPQGNKHWRGVIMLNEVHEGAADICEISLNYLLRKYDY